MIYNWFIKIIHNPARSTTYIIVPLKIGTVILSFTPIENNSIKGAERPPKMRIYGEISKSVYKTKLQIRIHPKYASVPSTVLFKILCLPNAKPNILPKVSPNIKNVPAAIAISFGKTRIVIKKADRNIVIEEKA